MSRAGTSSSSKRQMKWRVLGKVDYENIRKIENIGTPIGALFEIHVGIATLDDEVYTVEDSDLHYCIKRYEGRDYKIERAITRELVKLPLIKAEDDLKLNKLRIIFPYRKVTPKRYVLINEYKLKHQFPKCYDYLCVVKGRLSLRDKGKKALPSWYAYGRTQGFVSSGKRLYTKTFSRGPNFILGDGDALFCNGYALFGERDISMVKKILNSVVMDYYVKKTSYEIEGNFQCYQKNFIERFSIPNLNAEERLLLTNLTDKSEIDEWLVKKYDLVLLK